jgi:hypothetical protein
MFLTPIISKKYLDKPQFLKIRSFKNPSSKKRMTDSE